MDWFMQLITGAGVAHSVLVIALVIAFGVALSKIKIKGISLGVTWVLFVGILAGHYGFTADLNLLNFLKEFGLILFVYSIGLQVGPGFFSSLRKGGLTLNLLAVAVVFTGVLLTVILYYVTGIPISTMVGILSGAVTNTPGLGAAQQAAFDMLGREDPGITAGYAVAYPLGVVGVIAAMIALRRIFKVDVNAEADAATQTHEDKSAMPCKLSLLVENPALEGKTIGEIHDLINRNFVITRKRSADGFAVSMGPQTVLHLGDDILVVTSKAAAPAITAFIGRQTDLEWHQLNTELISRRILVTKNALNGKTLAQLRLRSFGVNVTRVYRAGIELMAHPSLVIQLGDRVNVVGTDAAIAEVEKVMGNSLKRLDQPNLFPLFLGIALGVIVGSIPFSFPGVPQSVKLGLAGGPLIVAILISRYGPYYRLVTYTATGANFMLREIGITLFLACVGLSAGETFVPTIISGGYMWILYGALITVLPMMLVGIVGRAVLKMNYVTLLGLMAGSMTNPLALSYATGASGNDVSAVSYATVYPLTMFLRVLLAQVLIIFL